MPDQLTLTSVWLQRDVQLDCYVPPETGPVALLLLNDGQYVASLGMDAILDNLYSKKQLRPVFAVAIHAGSQRKQEYGTAKVLDSRGRGAKAAFYKLFVLRELLPFLEAHYRNLQFREKAFAGFSLGGLSALDIVWNNPKIFSAAGVFSGALWWRSRENPSGYSEDTDRIMHRQVREGAFTPGMQFFFECGTADEKNDRNKNGVIDTIDDTKDLINELVQKGYVLGKNVQYLEIRGGKHDTVTWKKTMEEFLKWGWKRGEVSV